MEWVLNILVIVFTSNEYLLLLVIRFKPYEYHFMVIEFTNHDSWLFASMLSNMSTDCWLFVYIAWVLTAMALYFVHLQNWYLF